MILDIRENPFYILDASIYDNKEKIIQLANKKYSSNEITIIDDAKDKLTDSNKRFYFELRWFHFGEEYLNKLLIFINNIIQNNKYNDFDILNQLENESNKSLMANIPEGMLISYAPKKTNILSEYNLNYYLFPYIEDTDVNQIVKNILSLAYSLDIILIEFEDIVKQINEDRLLINLTNIDDSTKITSSKKNFIDDSNELIFNKLDNIHNDNLYKVLKIIQDTINSDNDYTNNKLLNSIISKYKNVYDTGKLGEIYSDLISVNDNPFHVLNIEVYDNKEKIISSYEQKMLFENSSIITSAQEKLLNPRSRLIAEMMWFSSCSKEQRDKILNYLNELPHLEKKYRFEIEGRYHEFHTRDGKDTGYLEGGIGNISFLDAFNIRFYSFPYMLLEKNEKPIDYYAIITELFVRFSYLNKNSIFEEINKHRVISGFPLITDIDYVDNVLLFYRDNIKKIYSKFFQLNEINYYAKIANEIVNRLRKNDYILLEDFLSEYELSIKDVVKNGLGLIDNIEKVFNKQYLNNIETSLDIIITNLKNWDFLVQPLQLHARNKGIRHEDSYFFANKMRELALFCNKEIKRHDLALNITKELKIVFAELPEFSSLVTEDEKILGGIGTNIDFENAINTFNEIIAKINKTISNKESLTLENSINTVSDLSNKWHNLMSRLNLNASEKSSLSVAYENLLNAIRSLALYTHNEAKRTDLSLKLIRLTQSIFYNHPSLLSKLSEDEETLKKINTQKLINDVNVKHNNSNAFSFFLSRIYWLIIIGVAFFLIQTC